MANLTPKKKWDQVPELIVKMRGNVSAIARALQMPRTSVIAKIQADETLKSLLADERERMVDNAEDQLGLAVNKGEAWAVCFTLKTRGQKRGYIEKVRNEHSGIDGQPMQTEVVFKVEVVDSADNQTSQDQ